MPAVTDRVAPAIQDVTLTSHLDGALIDDPRIELGQTIRVIPHESEPPSGRTESVIVELPTETPYSGDEEQYFLRGYAIGQLSSHNVALVCYSFGSAARQHESWNSGLTAGRDAWSSR